MSLLPGLLHLERLAAGLAGGAPGGFPAARYGAPGKRSARANEHRGVKEEGKNTQNTEV